MIYKVEKRLNENNCNIMAYELNETLNNGDDVIIDLKNTEYIDSSGLKIIIMFLKTFRAKGCDFSIVNANSYIEKIFSAIGIDDLFLLPYEERKRKNKKIK